jgi:hypothetical protein
MALQVVEGGRAGGKLPATLSDTEAARQLADFHRDIAAELPVDSRMRAAALRCGGHWARLAGNYRMIS